MTLKGNERPLILSVLMIVFVLLWGISGIAWGIIAYIVLSLVTRSQSLNNTNHPC